MKRIRSTCFSITLALSLFCMTAFALVNSASAHTVARSQVRSGQHQLSPNTRVLGGLNLNQYCQALGYTGVSLDGSTVYDWYCVDQNGNHIAFSMQRACQWQYQQFQTLVLDRFSNFYDASSEQCWGGGTPQ